jgi:hypothetical protein
MRFVRSLPIEDRKMSIKNKTILLVAADRLALLAAMWDREPKAKAFAEELARKYINQAGE